MDENPPPSDDAYGRVTAPEKYSVVHDAARALISDLVRRYDVTESTADGADVDPGGRTDVVRAVRLVPSREDAAPLAIGFTPFPGLLVRFGTWHVQAFPSCGCDACDESPGEVVRELTDHVTALVEGRFREEVAGLVRPWRSVEFVGPGGAWRRSSSQRLDRAARRRRERRGRRDWRTWPLRTVG